MSKSLPTVAVNRGGHLAIINESDFNPDTDILWSEDHTEKQPQGIRVGGDEKTPQTQETEVAALESPAPALALINSDKPLRDITIIDTLGKAAAEIILSRRPIDGYESLAQVWELCPEVLTGRMKVDPDVVAGWGSVLA